MIIIAGCELVEAAQRDEYVASAPRTRKPTSVDVRRYDATGGGPLF